MKLKSNFYEVKHFADEIIHYDVTISDGRTEDNFSKRLNHLIVQELVRSNKNIFRSRPVYDAEKSLYSMDELPFRLQVSMSNAYELFK